MAVTRIDPLAIPAAVLAVIEQVRAAGGRAWVVGGAVRDLLRGDSPVDFDLATDLAPERVATIAGDAAPANLREARFGTCRMAADEHQLTITTLRREANYRDQRHPDSVEFVRDPALDAPRRDFRVNALYYDPLSGELVDPVGGVADLAAKRLTMIGDPAERLAEDPIRLLRLVRLAAKCAFEIEAQTAAAARSCAPSLQSLAAERQFDELTTAFTSTGRAQALRLLVSTGLAAVVLPEVAAMDGVPQPPEFHPEGDVLVHTALVLEHVDAGDAVLAWSAVLHDIGKPPTYRVAADRIRFDGHDVLSAQMADEVLRRFKAPRNLRERVIDICRHHIRFAALPGMRPVRAERWLRTPGFRQHLAFHRADCLGSHGKLEIWEFARKLLAELPPLREPLLTGKDVLALGIPPGEGVGELLRAVDRAIAEAAVPPTRDAALVLLRDMVEQQRQADRRGDR